jgi:hypothetical protein
MGVILNVVCDLVRTDNAILSSDEKCPQFAVTSGKESAQFLDC